jgi:alanyl-tRNA synthetase
LIDIKLESEETSKLKKIEPTDFLPMYDWSDIESKILKIFNSKKELVDKVTKEDYFGIITEKTNFYSEKGGQIYDIGLIVSKDGDEKGTFEVKNCQSYAGYTLHIGILKSGSLQIDDNIILKPDFERRKPISSNHTTTHLLNYGLRKVIGNKVIQQGSEVTEEKLRFDFKHTQKITEKELEEIENIVKKQINSSLTVYTKVEEIGKAKNIPNIVLLEGEEYPNPVRVISIGKNVDELTENDDLSLEFCGGTHLSNTIDAEDFTIVSELGVSKGTRRIIGVTKSISKKYISNSIQFQKLLNDCKKLEGNNFVERVATLQVDITNFEIPLVDRYKYEKELEELFKKSKNIQKQLEKDILDNSLSYFGEIANNFNSNYLILDLSNFKPNKKVIDKVLETALKNEKTKIVPIMMISVISDKISITTMVPESLKQKISAASWASETAVISNGKAGGSEMKGQGQGLDSSKIKQSVEKAHHFATQCLNN